MKVYRYPGVRPFEAADKALFFGRDRDIADLYEMIRAERLVVLFGKSGYGKSSLLNAGVLPRLRQVLTPVEVRLGEYIAGQSFPPVETVQRKAALPLKLKPEAAFLVDLPTTLWTHFKQLDSAEKGAYLLVFDQFEEFFSYPPEQQRAFRDQLADLLSGELPEDLREAARTLDREQRRLLTAPMDIRVLFAIRSDRLHELDRLKDRLPAILHKRYELKALSREQAREAIIGPAALTDPRPDLREGRITMTPMKDEWAFASPPFEYREDALTNILNGLAITATVQQSGVEAFQLQILCDSIESRVAAGLVPDRDGNGRPDVTAADLPDFTEVFAQYYERRLAHLPETERAAARRVIEDGLVRYDPFTDEGRRLSVDGQALLKDYENIGLHPELLRELENTFLVRREPNTLGGHNYELSHDTLLAPVVRAKKQRMAEEEEQRRAAEEATERERLRQEREKIARARRRNAVVGLLAFALLGFALWQMKAAGDAVDLAEQKTRDAEISDSLARVKTRDAEISDSLARVKTRAAEVSDSLAGIEKRNAAAATRIALAAQKEADQKTKEAAVAQEAARIAKAKAQTAIKQSGIDSEKARLASLEAEQKRKEADEATRRAEEAKIEAQKAAEQGVTAMLTVADKAIKQLNYAEASEAVNAAVRLEADKPAVAAALLELAFFHNHTGDRKTAAQETATAARWLNRPDLAAQAERLTTDTRPLALRAVQKALAPARFKELDERYFPRMIAVKGGTFTPGCVKPDDDDCREYNKDGLYQATVSDFELAETETTVWQYNLYATAMGRSIAQRISPADTLREYSPSWGWIGDHPVVFVNWNDALEYANWASEQQGLMPVYDIVKTKTERDTANKNSNDKYGWLVRIRESANGYCLPTEAEWEFAARGGIRQDSFQYAGSDDLGEVAWWYKNSGSRTQPVGGKKPNSLQLYDLSGNVWEWCWDWYGDYPQKPETNYRGLPSGQYRALRGGSWVSYLYDIYRPAIRGSSYPYDRVSNYGFRVARH